MTTRRRAASLAVLAFAAVFSGAHVPASSAPPSPPAIKHVFLLILENEGYDTTFGAATLAKYLADTMVKSGALLRQYYGIGHFSLDNYVAMISGIAPNERTQLDCYNYEEFVQTGTSPDGQPIGLGCVYPASVQTLANQLEARGLTWKGYMEDMGNNKKRESDECGHPAIGTPDLTQAATVDDQYAAKHDPFVYFHALLDSGSCKKNVVPITKLEGDLRSASRTPSLVFITPSLCHDGHDRPCVNGEAGGLESANAFLGYWVPRITRSAAFRDGGMLIVTFDEALSIDASACCGEPTGPNTLKPGVNGPGGGRIGAVIVSPFVKPGTISDVPYNHYSLLKSIEEAFGLPYLGYAGKEGLVSFGSDVYTADQRKP